MVKEGERIAERTGTDDGKDGSRKIKSLKLEMVYKKKPVFLDEILKILEAKRLALLKKRLFIIDSTLGTGGHSLELVKRGFDVLAIDADIESIKLVKKKVKSACPAASNLHSCGKITFAHGNFRDIDRIASSRNIKKVDGILFDLGISEYQLESVFRGFSFLHPDAPLDMRIDTLSNRVKASDLLMSLSEKNLVRVFAQTLPAWYSRMLAKKVLEVRRLKAIKKVGDFLEVVNDLKNPKPGLHKATLPFLALRIAVNSELENLSLALPKSFKLLRKNGVMIVISFHSGEDKIVKRFFKDVVGKGLARLVTKKPILPDRKNQDFENRFRSAKMRVIEKIKDYEI